MKNYFFLFELLNKLKEKNDKHEHKFSRKSPFWNNISKN